MGLRTDVRLYGCPTGTQRRVRFRVSCPYAARCTTTDENVGRAQAAPFVVEAYEVPLYAVVAVPPSLVGIAVVVAVIRAKRDDLPDIVRALMRLGPRDDGTRKTPPPQPPPEPTLTRTLPGRSARRGPEATARRSSQ